MLLTKPSEISMLIAGFLMLISVPLIMNTEFFGLWFFAKGLYVIGAALILFKK